MSAVSRWIDDRLDVTSIRRTLLERKMPGGLTWMVVLVVAHMIRVFTMGAY